MRYFMGQYLKKQLNASYGANHTVTESLRIICIENMSVTANHIICKKIMHSLLLPYGEIKIYKKTVMSLLPYTIMSIFHLKMGISEK